MCFLHIYIYIGYRVLYRALYVIYILKGQH